MSFYEFIILLIVLLVILMIVLYNNIIQRKNEVANAFSSIDVMLKKRYDLIPNLVEITKQYANYEQSLLSDITKIRSQIDTKTSIDEKIKTHNEIQGKISSMFMNVENYPNLKADSTYINLMENWTTSEEQISASRRYFNSAVTEYNNGIQTFPASIIASIFNFTPLQVAEIAEAERLNVDAKKLFNS